MNRSSIRMCCLGQISKLFALIFISTLAPLPLPAAEAIRHGLAMHGAPALAPDFRNFSYVNPNAPKGGRLVLGVQGTFDSLNPFPVKGLTAAHGIAGLVVEPLMRRSLDEPFTLYPLIARAVEMPEDRSAITFVLDKRAAFADGRPVTTEDVRFSFDLLRTKGRPNYRNSYDKVAKVETPDPHTIRFDLSEAGDRELPLILGLMPVLPKHGVDPETFEASTFQPLVGSGPYVTRAVNPGESITYRRNPA